MFYSQYILARKGPLGKIWLAAHFEKKLTKSQVFATDITESVQTIVNPTVPLALRVSGHLMLGIVRIYSDKVRYLSADCRDAMTRINLAFRVQTSRVDIDEAAGGKIDDANYALLPMEDDDQSAQVAFQRKVARSISKLDESDVTSFFAVGEIELLRNDMSRPSIQSRRSSSAIETSRRSIDQKRDEDILPAFDANIGDNFFNDTNFETYEPFELPPEPISAEKQSPMRLPHTMEEDRSFDIAPMETTAVRVKVTKAKRRKVEINDQVEIPDRQWKQRLVDVHSIVRQPRNVSSAAMDEGDEQLDNMFQDVTGSLHYCPELSNLVGIFSERGISSFPLMQREQAEEVSQPELLRRQSGLESSGLDMESGRDVAATRRSVGGDMSMVERRESFAPDFSHDHFDYGMEDNMNFMPSNDKDFGAVSSVVEKSLMPSDFGTQEHFDDEQKSERTKAVLTIVEQELQQSGEESLQNFCAGCTKAVAARFFLELLQLKTWGKIELTQADAYEPIMVKLV